MRAQERTQVPEAFTRCFKTARCKPHRLRPTLRTHQRVPFGAWRGISGYLVHCHERADSGCPCCYPSHRLRYHVSRSAHPGFPAELSGYALLKLEEIFELRQLDDKLPLVPGAALEGDAVVHRAVVRAPRYDDVHGCGVG